MRTFKHELNSSAKPDCVVAWSYQAQSPAELPGANLIFDGLDQLSAASSG